MAVKHTEHTGTTVLGQKSHTMIDLHFSSETLHTGTSHTEMLSAPVACTIDRRTSNTSEENSLD
jgi:hypothetical protein